MSIVLQGSTSGSITLQEPAVAGSTVLSLPATTGTILTSASPASDLPSSIKGPAFSAFRSSGQTVSNTTWTKIQFDTEEFDTANCYDNTTNYRFTPNVAGYYQCNWMIQFDTNVSTLILTSVYKNGTSFKRGDSITGGSYSAGGSALIYMNGSTDYIEAYIYQASGGNRTTETGAASIYFQASMVRAA